MTNQQTKPRTTISLSEALRRAADCYHTGRLGEAEAYYKRILGSAEALQGLAAIAYRRGRADEALGLIRTAIAENATSAEALFHCGRSLAEFRQSMRQSRSSTGHWRSSPTTRRHLPYGELRSEV